MEKCPHCDSRHPHLHPAVQCEGEVEICTHDFHLIPTNQNRQEYIDNVLAKRSALGRRLQRTERRHDITIGTAHEPV